MGKLKTIWYVLTSRNYFIVCDAGVFATYKKWQHNAFIVAIKKTFDEIDEQDYEPGSAALSPQPRTRTKQGTDAKPTPKDGEGNE